MIAEPYPEVRELLALIMKRQGHSVLLHRTADASAGADLLLAEPATHRALELAYELRAASPELPIVVVSFLPQPAAWTALEPAAYVLKPFMIARLESAVESALALRRVTAA
jgi:DNA-binding response OmpR family regulator